MSKTIRLNESDLNKVIRNVINEMMAYEEGTPDATGRDKYYYGCGWKNPRDNRFNVEGAIGENYEGFLTNLKEYVAYKIQEYEQKSGSHQRGLDQWLAGQKERHGKYTKPTQQRHESIISMINKSRGTNYPAYLSPSESSYSLHDMYLDRIAHEKEYFDKWLQRDLIVSVDMPVGDHNSAGGARGWRRYAQSAPSSKRFQIDPENIEDAAQQAWAAFNEYAQRTPGVIGWFLWSWSTFQPTIRPILSPEIGQEISDEGDKISRFYDSLSYKGD